MIRHVVLFRWRQGFDPSYWFESVSELPNLIPELKRFSVGPNILNSNRSWDAAIVADFDRPSDVAVYTNHPAHKPLVEMSAAGAEQIVSVDFELDEEMTHGRWSDEGQNRRSNWWSG